METSLPEDQPIGDPLDSIAIDIRVLLPTDPNIPAISSKLAELYSALDDLHCQLGGSGLTVEGGDIFVAQQAGVANGV